MTSAPEIIPPDQFDRRALFERAGLTAGAIALAGLAVTEVYSLRPGAMLHNLEDGDQKLNDLSAQAALLDAAGVFTADPLPTFTNDGVTTQPAIRTGDAINALLIMGYLEDGDTGSQRMADFISSNHIHLREFRDAPPAATSYATVPALSRLIGEDGRLIVEVNPAVFNGDYNLMGGLAQALYLVEQQARDGAIGTGLLRAVSLTTAASLGVASYSSARAAGRMFRRFLDGTFAQTSVSRREFGMAAASFGVATAGLDLVFLAPSRQQATVQAGDASDNYFGSLASQPQLKEAIKNIVTYNS